MELSSYHICLPTLVSASVYGKAPANPIKDPCNAIYLKNGQEIHCQIEISLSGLLRSGKILDNAKINAMKRNVPILYIQVGNVGGT